MTGSARRANGRLFTEPLTRWGFGPTDQPGDGQGLELVGHGVYVPEI